MIATDEDALFCDIAETYGILDMRALPARKLAALSCGLRDNSRIKMRLSGTRVAPEIMLLACAVDKLSLLVWAKTEDARRGRNRPASILQQLLQTNDSAVTAFESAEAWEAARARIIEEVNHGN